jgi:hypothetical protein
MGSIVAVLLGVGPMAAVLALLATRMRRRRTVWPLRPSSFDWTGGPPPRPQRSNDRSPIRPRRPTLSGGMALEVPRPPVDGDDDLSHAVA